MNEGTTMLEHLNFFNKVINELLTIDVKIDEEDKALILLSSLSQSYDHTSPSRSTVRKQSSLRRSCQLSYLTRLENIQIKRSKHDWVWGHRKERKRRRKKGPGSSKACHFYHKGGYWKNCCKHRQKWLKKEQTAEADVASGVSETEILMASYVEDNTSQGKNWIFDSGSTVHICSQKKLFTPWLQKRKGPSRWWMVGLRSHRH